MAGPVMIGDTTVEAERMHLRLMREAGQLRRSELASRMSTATLRRARAACAAAHPHLSAWEADLRFLAVHHGHELAARVRGYVEARAGNAA